MRLGLPQRRPARGAMLGGMLSVALGLASAQTASPVPPLPPAQPAAATAPVAAASKPQEVQITGARSNDEEARRRSTAAKIVIGREEIDRFGDSTLGDVLKRLPGVTLGGPPGRGGPIRMRGLGAGYTQILLDGERVPPGFSLDSLAPEQIERIEILRAPTAETGARAIGGTINIITREGFQKRINDVRGGFQLENARAAPGGIWTRTEKISERLGGTFTLAAFRDNTESLTTSSTTFENLSTGVVNGLQQEQVYAVSQRPRLNLSARLQYQDADGSNALLTPFVVHSAGKTRRRGQLSSLQGSLLPEYDHFTADTAGSFSMARFNGQYRHRLANGTRLEWLGGAGLSRINNHTLRDEFDAAGTRLHNFDDEAKIADRSGNLTLKATRLLDNEHSLVSGLETEAVRRRETRHTLADGATLLADFGENIQAASNRLALYAQDEWAINPNWSAHAGLRWEAIATHGSGEDGSIPTNTSRVLSPLAHAVWRPDPKSRDQIRMSLTRSYKAPTLQNLIARPGISARYPVSGSNTSVSPDRAGNAQLLPELARGIDLAFERYLPAGGVLSANLFSRRINNLIRNLTQLEDVSWSPVQRWVSRPHNVGDAQTRGLELEAKFKLSDAVTDAPPLELRFNGSFYRSTVASVPGPDNRLDQQPSASGNFGADWRIRGTPLMIGSNFSLTPAYNTRVSEDQGASTSRRRVFDAYALWTFAPGYNLRLGASNIAPLDFATGTSVLDDQSRPGQVLRNSTSTLHAGRTAVQVRLELKL